MFPAVSSALLPRSQGLWGCSDTMGHGEIPPKSSQSSCGLFPEGWLPETVAVPTVWLPGFHQSLLHWTNDHSLQGPVQQFVLAVFRARPGGEGLVSTWVTQSIRDEMKSLEGRWSLAAFRFVIWENLSPCVLKMRNGS